MTKTPTTLNLGVCYYPEHWPESSWQRDARRMKDMGLSWVRIGEFAWSRLEPAPNTLSFGWLGRAIDTLGRAGLKVVLGTPTATPPKWLINQYDDILQVGPDGPTRRFGSRRHYCFNSKSYRQETVRIVTLLAERYAKHEAVQAWQTDNEYGCHDTVRCYCPNCEAAFRVWLAEKYGDIKTLNEAWWSVFWSMEYRDFAEIDLPFQTVTEAHPGHRLDFYRFASDSVVSYNRLQTDIIREYSSRPVTHNFMIYFDGFDHFKLAQDLDIVTWDNYPLGMLEQSPLPESVKNHYLRSGHPDLISLMHDLYRGLNDKPFWVMEQQPGQVNWAPSNPIPAPGAVRLWSHQAFAHGADVVTYFRWRIALGAQELMHAGLNKYDGAPDVATQEAKQVHKELSAPPLAEIANSPKTIALLFDYENLWATNLQPHAQGWNYWTLVLSYYSALRSLGLDLSFTQPRRNLDKYKLVIAPALHLVDDSLARHLESYVEAGGQLILGPRSGMKTLSNLAHQISPLANLMGATITRVDALRPGVVAQISFKNETLNYEIWADLLEPTSASTLASYQTPAYKGIAAITQNSYGQGSCTTHGLWGTPETLRTVLEPHLKSLVSVKPQLGGVRTSVRGGVRYTFNFNPDEVVLKNGERLEPCGVSFEKI